MITNHHFMGNSENGSQQESGQICNDKSPGTGSGIRHKLLMLGAAIGLGTAGCSAGNAQETKTPDAKEMKLATAEEARDFATLSREVQGEIRGKYDECIEDVKDFSNEETNPTLRQLDYDEGVDDCDGQRESRIGSAKAKQNMEDRTRRITSGS